MSLYGCTIDAMDKLKANFVLVMRRFVWRWIRPRKVRGVASPPVEVRIAPRHPLLGALKGQLGTDLTEPADPSWGKE
jgi:hypothetical protein